MTPEKLVELLQDPMVTRQFSEIMTDPGVARNVAELLRDPEVLRAVSELLDKAMLGLLGLAALTALAFLGMVYNAVLLRRLLRGGGAGRKSGAPGPE